MSITCQGLLIIHTQSLKHESWYNQPTKTFTILTWTLSQTTIRRYCQKPQYVGTVLQVQIRKLDRSVGCTTMWDPTDNSTCTLHMPLIPQTCTTQPFKGMLCNAGAWVKLHIQQISLLLYYLHSNKETSPFSFCLYSPSPCCCIWVVFSLSPCFTHVSIAVYSKLY